MSTSSTFKQAVYTTCIQTLEQRIQDLIASIKDAEEAAQEETKSSMGDKYENGREMAKLEIEKREEALKNLMSVKSDFERLNPNTVMNHVDKGSLLITNRAIFYIAGSLGKIEVDGKPVMVISRQAPIFSALQGFENNTSINFNGVQYNLLGKE